MRTIAGTVAVLGVLVGSLWGAGSAAAVGAAAGATGGCQTADDYVPKLRPCVSANANGSLNYDGYTIGTPSYTCTVRAYLYQYFGGGTPDKLLATGPTVSCNSSVHVTGGTTTAINYHGSFHTVLRSYQGTALRGQAVSPLLTR